jgi:HSP20 family protein
MYEGYEPFKGIRRFKRVLRGCQEMGGFEMPNELREPLTDIMDEGGELVALMEIPGASKDKIEVSVTPTVLKVKNENKEEKEETGNEYYYRERRQSGFYRVISLPTEVIPEQVKANYKNGVLEIRMKKRMKEIPGKDIKIE